MIPKVCTIIVILAVSLVVGCCNAPTSSDSPNVAELVQPIDYKLVGVDGMTLTSETITSSLTSGQEVVYQVVRTPPDDIAYAENSANTQSSVACWCAIRWHRPTSEVGCWSNHLDLVVMTYPSGYPVATICIFEEGTLFTTYSLEGGYATGGTRFIAIRTGIDDCLRARNITVASWAINAISWSAAKICTDTYAQIGR